MRNNYQVKPEILKEIIMSIDPNYKLAIEFIQQQLDEANKSVEVVEKMLKQKRELRDSLQDVIGLISATFGDTADNEVTINLNDLLDKEKKLFNTLIKNMRSRLTHDMEITAEQLELLSLTIDNELKSIKLHNRISGNGK